MKNSLIPMINKLIKGLGCNNQKQDFCQFLFMRKTDLFQVRALFKSQPRQLSAWALEGAKCSQAASNHVNYFKLEDTSDRDHRLPITTTLLASWS